MPAASPAPDAQVSGPFAAALHARRARFNALFADERRLRPGLDGATLAAHLRTLVAPIVDRAEAVRPGSAAAVTDALYELSLDLLAREFLGPRSRYPAIVAG